MGYQAYPEYKESRVEWLDQVPSHWNVERLRFSIQTNPTKSEIKHLSENLPVSFVPMEAVGELGGLCLDTEKEISEVSNGYSYFADGDVLIAKITPCFENGKGAIAKDLINGVGFGTTELHVLRSEKFLNRSYLFYLSISHPFRDIGASQMLGAGGQKRVTDEFIRDFRTGLPSLPEQETIAEFLDHKTAQIDSLIEKKQELVEKLQEQRITVITRAVTKGLNSGVTLKDSGVEWLGDLPAHWDIWRLRFSVTMSGGMTPSTTAPQYWEGPIPWVTPKDMKSDRITSSIDTLTELALEETSLQLYTPSQVLIVVRGMILAHTFPVGVNDVDVTVNQDMKVLSTTLNSEYLAILLRGFQSVVLSIVEESAHGTKVLRTDLFKNIQLPVPPSHEQEAIVEYIHNVIAKSDSRIEAVNTAITRLQEYRTALITAAVTGQIDVRDWQAPAALEQSAQNKDVA